MEEFKLTPKQKKKKNTAIIIATIIAVVLGVLFIIFSITTIVLAIEYEDRVAPGLYIGRENIGGMTKDQLKDFLRNKNDQLATNGINISFGTNSGEKEVVLYPIVTSDGNSYELVYVDVQSEVERIIRFGKRGGIMLKGLSNIVSALGKPIISLKYVELNEEKVKEELENLVKDYESQPVSASIQIINTNPLKLKTASSSVGVIFEIDEAIKEIEDKWSMLNIPNIKIKKVETDPDFVEGDLADAEQALINVFSAGPMFLTYDFGTGSDFIFRGKKIWEIGVKDLASWVEPQRKDNKIVFGLNKEKVNLFLEKEIGSKVNVDAQDAKFSIDENGKVEEFQGSRPGYEIDAEANYETLNNAFIERNYLMEDAVVTSTFELVIAETEPNTITGEANDLGITEVLGVGVSNFGGSPKNRIKNIQNAVRKLNGVLIKPGEEFSTIKFTKPYSEAGGYFPELVIKGDEITPEIGGGLCQIGTTLFRMAMNSGMKITERRSHSLAVSYYSDPVNHLPGTDATLYDPSPDFKFLNDTENYILLQTSIDWNKMELVFTLWGTSDGREASYTRPVVSRWIPHGPTKFIETTKLAPGVRQCQHAYTGADAYFTYTRKLPDQEAEEIIFESHYRPLPEICLVGVGESGTPTTGDVSTDTTAIE